MSARGTPMRGTAMRRLVALALLALAGPTALTAQKPIQQATPASQPVVVPATLPTPQFAAADSLADADYSGLLRYTGR